MDAGWRKRQREWANGNETAGPKEKLHFFKRAGKMEEGVRGLSDDELISLFRSWGIELTRGNFADPAMFFEEDLFDRERFEIWVFVQARFPLRLQTEADLRWFNALPDEEKRRIDDANIHRSEELLNPNIIPLDFLQESENVIFPLRTHISETISLSPPLKKSPLIESFSKLINPHPFTKQKKSSPFESFSRFDFYKKPSREELVRRLLEPMPSDLERSVRERFMEVLTQDYS